MKTLLKVKKNSLTAGAKTIISNFPASTPVVIGKMTTGMPGVFLMDEDGKPGLCAGQIIEIADAETGSPVAEDALFDTLSAGYKASSVSMDGDSTSIYVVSIEVEAKEIKKIDFSSALADAKTVASEFAPMAEIDERVEYMLKANIPEAVVIAVLNRYRSYKTPCKRPSTLYVDLSTAVIDPKSGKIDTVLNRAITNMLSQNAIDFIGDKSVGKNVCAETLSWLFNKPYYLVTFSRQMTPDDVWGCKTTVPPEITRLSEKERVKLAMANIKLQGGYELTEEELYDAARFQVLSASAAALEIRQEESALANAIMDGGVIVFNEMDMAESNFLASFANQLTDGTGFIDIPGHGRQKISPDFNVIGTQNDNEAGAESQNRPTLSRFGGIRFSYPDSVINQLKAATLDYKLPSGYYTACERFYKAILKATHSASPLDNGCLNIRGLVRALKLVKTSNFTISLKTAISDHVITLCKADDIQSLMHHLDSCVDDKL